MDGRGVSFSVAVPKGKSCKLCIYRGNHTKPYRVIQMEEDILYGDIRSSGIQTDIRDGDEYIYEIDGAPYVDPYAHGIRKYMETEQDGTEVECRRAVLCTPDFEWEHDRPLDLPDEDVIAYSLHVRGFTKGQSSRVKIRELLQGSLRKFLIFRSLELTRFNVCLFMSLRIGSALPPITGGMGRPTVLLQRSVMLKGTQ